MRTWTLLIAVLLLTGYYQAAKTSLTFSPEKTHCLLNPPYGTPRRCHPTVPLQTSHAERRRRRDSPPAMPFPPTPRHSSSPPTSAHLPRPAAPRGPRFWRQTSVKKRLHPYRYEKLYFQTLQAEFEVSTRKPEVFSSMGGMRKDETKYKPGLMSHICCRIVQALNQGWVSLHQSLHQHGEDGLGTSIYVKATTALWFGLVLSPTVGKKKTI